MWVKCQIRHSPDDLLSIWKEEDRCSLTASKDCVNQLYCMSYCNMSGRINAFIHSSSVTASLISEQTVIRILDQTKDLGAVRCCTTESTFFCFFILYIKCQGSKAEIEMRWNRIQPAFCNIYCLVAIFAVNTTAIQSSFPFFFTPRTQPNHIHTI